MKILFILLFSILLPIPELAVYKNDAFRFEVQFPKQFKEESQILEEKFGAIEMVRLSGQEVLQVGETKATVVYSVVASRYQTNEGFKRSGTKLPDLVYNHSKHINQESFLMNNYIILSEKHSKDFLYYVVGNSSMELITTKKIFIRNEMAYTLSITSPSGFLTREEVNTFFKSLKINPK